MLMPWMPLDNIQEHLNELCFIALKITMNIHP